MITLALTSAISNKPVWIVAAHIVAIVPGTTGSEILTTSGVIYRVKESPKEVLSATAE